MNDAQATAIAAYILAGFPNAGVPYDANPAKASDIYTSYACVVCHGQVGQPDAPNPLSPDKRVPELRNQNDTMMLADLATAIDQGSIPAPGKRGEIFMPAWGQIMSTEQLKTILTYIPDGLAGKTLPPPPPASPLPLAGP